MVGQTPAFYLKVMQQPGFDDLDLSHIRRAITYGGTMPHAMFEGFAKVAPELEWVTLWSQSELTQTPTIGRFRSLADVPGHDPSWIGRPTAQLEVRVVDADGNDALEGEIICRSPGVMRGYYKNPEKTAETLRDGWLHTGDNVRIDADGNLFFLDRQKDMIKTGGLNVSSVEVERALYTHPAVLEVAVRRCGRRLLEPGRHRVRRPPARRRRRPRRPPGRIAARRWPRSRYPNRCTSSTPSRRTPREDPQARAAPPARPRARLTPAPAGVLPGGAKSRSTTKPQY